MIGPYLELTKPRVTTLVVLTTAAGFYLGSLGAFDWILFLHVVLGTAFVAGGTAVVNQVMEQVNDGRMRRTARRPLPAGRVASIQALVFGLVLVLGGTVYLGWVVNLLTASIGFITSFVYLLAYTPLKTRTPWCTTIGAFSGATPPVMGWTAIRGELGIEAWLLFLILFFWQFPHFLAIAWVYKEDYERGGFRMLPLLDHDGKKTGFRVVTFNLALLCASIVPTFVGLAGGWYLAGAVIVGVAYLWYGVGLARFRTHPSARRLLRCSVLYLPVLLILMVADKV
jgi:protoheme IX farnesyltransferase